MVNEDFAPDERQEQLLAVLKEGRDAGEPWGYATVKRFSEEADLRKQYVNRALEGLLGAGWVEKPYRGLYRFVNDPREDT
jgi:DNA-binding IclR family transcriptional regulator